MSFDTLKQQTYNLNMDLSKSGLITLTFGNASVVDRAADGGEGVMAIKPSGVPYDKLTPNDMVVLSLANGEILEGSNRPSSDTPTHLHLLRSFPHVAAIIHTHSTYATAFAQAHRTIHCLGTTHADHFYGTVPVTRQMTPEEIADAYELNTGKVIVETFQELGISPDDVPAVLVASHAPFAWGKSPEKALTNAIALEATAQMQLAVLQLNPNMPAVPQPLLDKHFKRKHGPNAYYGQK